MSEKHGNPEEPRPETPSAEDRAARGESWLLIGGVLAWKALASIADFVARSKQPRPEPKPQTSPKEPLESPAGQLIEAGAEAAWKTVSLTAAAVQKVVKEHPLLPESRGDGSEPAGRLSDRNLDLEKGVRQLSRIRWGSLFVGGSVLASMAAGLGFLWIYWTGGNNLLLGGCLAIFLGGLGAALVFWAHWLTIHKEATEPREELPSAFPDRDAVVSEFHSGVGDVQRRTLLQWTGVAAVAMVTAMVVSLVKSLGFPPGAALYTRVWKRGQRLVDLNNKPVKVSALDPGSMMLVFPENSVGSEKSQTVLLRVHQDLLRLPPERADWAPQGYLAYSRVCTHAGCAVGMYESTTHLLMCPCHQSTFDVLDGAQPTGGPAARPLPQLPLYADSQGFLRAADGFTEPPGPGFWGMP